MIENATRTYQAVMHANSRVLVLLLSSFLMLPAAFARTSAFDPAHRLFTKDLRKFVRGGCVNYRGWSTGRGNFDKYISNLASLTKQRYDSMSPDEKKALWLNVYNALAIKTILDNYPIHGKNQDYPPESLRQLPDCWRLIKIQVAGAEVDLYTIKHKILRSEIHDYRTHFAVVPASKGALPLCPPAFTADELESRLEGIVQQFMKNPANIQYVPEQNLIRVSRIFRWFALDFTPKDPRGNVMFPPPPDAKIVQKFVLRYAPEPMRKHFENIEARIEFLPYDWSLNECR